MAKTPKNHRREWTPADETKAVQMAPTRPVGIIANTLGRTEDAIRAKVQELGGSFGGADRPPYGKPAGAPARRHKR